MVAMLFQKDSKSWWIWVSSKWNTSDAATCVYPWSYVKLNNACEVVNVSMLCAHLSVRLYGHRLVWQVESDQCAKKIRLDGPVEGNHDRQSQIISGLFFTSSHIWVLVEQIYVMVYAKIYIRPVYQRCVWDFAQWFSCAEISILLRATVQNKLR